MQERNDLGLQLIERNEEVCVFYERQNVSESLLRKAGMELSAREEELHFLRMEVREGRERGGREGGREGGKGREKERRGKEGRGREGAHAATVELFVRGKQVTKVVHPRHTLALITSSPSCRMTC